MIRWKIPQTSKNTFQISTYILNGWEMFVLTKQKSSSNETNINKNK